MRALFLTHKSERFSAGLHPLLKLCICAAGSLCTLLFGSPYSLGLLACGALALALTATGPATLIRVFCFLLITMLISFGFTLLLSLFIPGLIRWNPVSLSVPYLRMLVMVLLLVWLALSTPVQDLYGTLQRLRLPGFLFIPLSVAIRFIPTFMDDCAQIRDAARLRPARSIPGVWRCIVVPLIFRVLASADDLALAAMLKGLDPTKKMECGAAARFTRRDGVITGATLATVMVALVLQYFGPSVEAVM